MFGIKNVLVFLNKWYMVLCLGAIIIIAVLSDIWLMSLFSTEYQNKMNILASVLEIKIDISEEENPLKDDFFIKKLVPLLKENKTHELGLEKLKEYGYDKNNYYLKQYKKQIFSIILFTIGISLFISLSFYLVVYRFKVKRAFEFKAISNYIAIFKKGYFAQSSVPLSFTNDKDMEEIHNGLSLLYDYVNFKEETAQLEREETKSLVTDISHQLKTPLAALHACFDILNQTNNHLTKEEQEEFKTRCENQLNGFEELLNELIGISRMESGMIQIKKENLPIFDTIIEAINRIYPKISEKNMDIEFEAEEELKSLAVMHDSKWFCEALINILDNAVKYSEENTCITIRMFKRSILLRIEIEDMGIGIPKSEYHEIFKRFYRGTYKKVKSQKGSGIGLYLTRKIISMHHGTIAVISNFDDKNGNRMHSSSGSTFVIQIPYL